MATVGVKGLKKSQNVEKAVQDNRYHVGLCTV